MLRPAQIVNILLVTISKAFITHISYLGDAALKGISGCWSEKHDGQKETHRLQRNETVNGLFPP